MTNLFPTLVQFRNKDKAKVGYAAAEALLRGTMFKNCQNTLIFQKFQVERATLHMSFSKNQHQNAYFWPKDSSRLNSNAPNFRSNHTGIDPAGKSKVL